MKKKMDFQTLSQRAAENCDFLPLSKIFKEFFSALLYGVLYHIRLIRKLLQASRDVFRTQMTSGRTILSSRNTRKFLQPII